MRCSKWVLGESPQGRQCYNRAATNLAFCKVHAVFLSKFEPMLPMHASTMIAAFFHLVLPWK